MPRSPPAGSSAAADGVGDLALHITPGLAVGDVAAALVHQRTIDDATLERARSALGERALVEVVTLVGFYQLVSGVLTTFAPPPPSGDLQVVRPPTQGAPK